MRLRTLLAATAVSALTIGGVGLPAHAATAPSPDKAGTLVTWGDQADPNGGAAIPVPTDLTGPVRSVAADGSATGVVTLDGAARVWGVTSAPEVAGAPTDVTDAAAIVLSSGDGAILHTDGRITAWGFSDAISEVPADLDAKAIALQGGTGYAVRPDGTLSTWGDAPISEPPAGLANLVDISATSTHVLALRSDGTVVSWNGSGAPGALDVPDFGGKKVVQIATAPLSSGVVFDDGTIDIWGFPFAIPAGEPNFDGLTTAAKVVSLSLGVNGGFGSNTAALTADGTVHVWGAITAVTDVPASLSGQPVSAIAMGGAHVAVLITTYRKLSESSMSGTPEVGQTLTATPATFSLAPDGPTTGQWYANAVPIVGQTGATLALDDSMVGSFISYHSSATRGDVTLTSESAEVTVAKATSVTRLTVSPATAAAGHARVATATVTRAGGTPTGTLTFKTGTTTRIVQLAGGKASWTLPTLPVGTRQVTATYNGSPTSSPSIASPVNIKVTRATSKVRATAKGNKASKKVTITITVATTKGVSPVGTVKVALKGKTKKAVTVRVNAQGKATVTLKKVKRGKYSVAITYGGNGNVFASRGSATFKF